MTDRSEHVRNSSYWRFDVSQKQSHLLWEDISTEDYRVGYAGFRLSPSGMIVAVRTVEDGTSVIVDSHTLEEGMTRAESQTDMVLLDANTGEVTPLPHMFSSYEWFDEHQLATLPFVEAVRDLPARLEIYDVRKKEVVRSISLPRSPGQLQRVANRVVAVEYPPDPHHPKTYDRAYLTRERGMIEVAHPEEQDSVADGNSKNTPGGPTDSREVIRPFDHAWFGHGELVLMDLSDPDQPKSRVLMDVVPLGHVSAISPDGRYVIVRPAKNPSDPDRASLGNIIYDTKTGRWQSFDMAYTRFVWHPLEEKLLVANQQSDAKLLIEVDLKQSVKYLCEGEVGSVGEKDE